MAGARDNRTNIALLGIGGPGHEGPYLTDTIIILSVEQETGKAAMLSVPRDLYIQTETFGGVKINAVYALSLQKKQGAGKLIKQTLSETFGIPIHYYVVVNFEGFVNLIDELNGVDVFVDTSFTDNQFPDKNFQMQSLYFEKGLQHMDGLKALQFARSRHGNAGEGSDFARARRQQKILLSVKDKLVSSNLIIRPDKIQKIMEILGNTIETDMELWEAVKLGELGATIGHADIIQKVLDDSPQGELYASTGIDGAFLLLPKNPSQLITLAQNIFTLNETKEEGPRIIIQNGTEIDGFAETIKKTLEENGIEVVRIENAPKQSYIKTVIYDLSRGSKPKTLQYMEKKLNANVSASVPVEMWRDNPGIDFVVILGKDFGST